MLIPEEELENFGLALPEDDDHSLMSRFLHGLGNWTYIYAKAVLLMTLVLVIVSAYGISKIQINDNPIKWFHEKHSIRVADKVLNEHFGGTYIAYLEFAPGGKVQTVDDYLTGMKQRLDTQKTKAIKDDYSNAESVFSKTLAMINNTKAETVKDFLKQLQNKVGVETDAASDNDYDTWSEVGLFLDTEEQRSEIFKLPEVLRYLAKLQKTLLGTGIVGKVNALPDIVKTVHRELFQGKDDQFLITDSANAVAQTLITYQNSHRPQDLWHFVTPNYRKSTMLLQLNSGDNIDMEKVIAAVDKFEQENPPPMGLKSRWFGLTYINVIWQNSMVRGMLKSFMGSFAIVLVMMIFLFRSFWLGLLSMIPLTVTVGFIYGVIGFIGKDYDMPVAVLSALSLGLAIDYAIHFLARSREAWDNAGNWKAAISEIFGEPARAITRNLIILGAGFLPLLAAPLVPYQTVGVFIAAILICAGIATLLILPAAIKLLEKYLFKGA